MSAVANDIQTDMPGPLLFTDSAAAKVADLIAEEGNPDLKLRVFVQGGGCSGAGAGPAAGRHLNVIDRRGMNPIEAAVVEAARSFLSRP